jgi:hypothetical protein
MAVERRVLLRLAAADGSSRVAGDLSAVHRDGAALWPATDEGLPELYRLTATADVVRVPAPAPRAPAGSGAGLASTHPPLRQTEVPS